METNNIINKLRKYHTKLKLCDNDQKKELYNNKINYYDTLLFDNIENQSGNGFFSLDSDSLYSNKIINFAEMKKKLSLTKSNNDIGISTDKNNNNDNKNDNKEELIKKNQEKIEKLKKEIEKLKKKESMTKEQIITEKMIERLKEVIIKNKNMISFLNQNYGKYMDGTVKNPRTDVSKLIYDISGANITNVNLLNKYQKYNECKEKCDEIFNEILKDTIETDKLNIIKDNKIFNSEIIELFKEHKIDI